MCSTGGRLGIDRVPRPQPGECAVGVDMGFGGEQSSLYFFDDSYDFFGVVRG